MTCWEPLCLRPTCGSGATCDVELGGSGSAGGSRGEDRELVQPARSGGDLELCFPVPGEESQSREVKILCIALCSASGDALVPGS